MLNSMKLIVPALSENEGFVRSCVAAFCTSVSPTLEEINDLKVAISEAVTNCVVHAYSTESQEKMIEIEAKLFKHSVAVSIRDFGGGIADIKKAMEPYYTTLSDEERSGMGFVLMQTFVDELKVNSKVGGGTVVELHKRFLEV